MADPLRIFIDANVLAAPLTRTLLLSAAQLSGYAFTWSAQAEAEADRHMRDSATPLKNVRTFYLDSMALCSTAELAARFTRTRGADRQILADAEASGSRFLITNNVDDFDAEDLHTAGVDAVTADLFMSHWVSPEGYRQALRVIARGQKNPPITAEDLHRNLSKVHPRLFAAQNDPYRLVPLAPTHNRPAVEYRGTRCIQCGSHCPAELRDGIGSSCCRGPQ